MAFEKGKAGLKVQCPRCKKMITRLLYTAHFTTCKGRK